MIWQCGEIRLDLTRRVAVMGILNVTPDSFSDGGRHVGIEQATAAGLRMLDEGAEILDVGGESTRPGAEPVAEEEELRRVIPVIEALHAARPEALISIDTCKATVAREAVVSGASIINDVTAMTGDPRMIPIAAACSAGVVLMHMRGTPQTMQAAPEYGDVVREVGDHLRERMVAAVAAGIDVGRIVLDPGIGFGKLFEHNLTLFRRLNELTLLGRPLLVGPSRKAFIGRILDLPVDQRLEGTAAAVAAAVLAGARIVRVHDVRAMTRVARVAEQLAPWAGD